MNIRSLLPCAAIGLLPLRPVAYAQDAPTPSQPAPVTKPVLPAVTSQAVTEFCRRHHAAKTLSFTATYYSFFGSELGFINLNTFVVQAKRPNLFAIRGGPNLLRVVRKHGLMEPTFYGDPLSICVCDGKTQFEMDPRLHFYTKLPAPSGFWPPTANAFQSIGANVSLNANLLDGFEPAPDEIIYRRPVVVFKHVIPHDAESKEIEILYFAANTGELIRYSTFSQFKGDVEESDRVEYDNWKFNARMPAETFAITLPADARPMSSFASSSAANPTQPDKH